MTIDFNIKAIFGAITGIVTLLGLLIGYAIAADERYVDVSELGTIQQQMLIDRRTDYQDRIDNIEDKKIDGTATPSDLKKMHRYRTRIKEIEQRIYKKESD